jgi:hypothetical protein
VETETVGVAENIILGCLLEKADVVYPLTLAEHIANSLREAGLLQHEAGERSE